MLIPYLDQVLKDLLMEKVQGLRRISAKNHLHIKFFSFSLLSCAGGGSNDGLPAVAAITPKRAERRYQVVSEMLDTEENYLCVLKTLIEVCFPPFELLVYYSSLFCLPKF